jgi:hypothetical protein
MYPVAPVTNAVGLSFTVVSVLVLPAAADPSINAT